ncbi:MAG TPA: 4Fe-4S binding protein [Thermohalobaculum sp.]|nr:4Fe-4S binding protein [Thermohalobaculum sp.]
MPATQPRLLLCDCTGTMRPDARAIARGCGIASDKVHTHLCRAEAGVAAAALKSGEPVIVACGQETPAFRALAEELGAEARLLCVDIRDRAGWSGEESGPKMAALIAEARLAAPSVPAIDVESRGVCLVLGRGEQAVGAAARLAPHLAVTCMLAAPEEVLPPAEAAMQIVAGRIRSASGALGRFALEIDGFAELEPAGRGPRAFGAPRDGATTECDLILDLTGGTPLFPAHHKRDGYLRADPGDPLAVERALFDAAQLVGTFEKPLHIRFEESLCAHSRAQQTACTRCLEVCPTGAISPNGDTVFIDPHVCAGCGACHAVCPSGAASSDDPPGQHLFRRMRVMAEAYRAAGGEAPRLLVHDAEHGAEMIRLAARYGSGLPGAVIPLELRAVSLFGHAEQLAALGLGYAGVDILAGPRTERQPLEPQIALGNAIAAGAGADGARIRLIEPADPDALCDLLYSGGPAPLAVEPILPLGGRRETVRLAARALAGGTLPEAPIALPEGAPYGAILVDTDACTLCLACASLCPTGAILDNPDHPEISFREEACIQCGLCANICPENAIRLVPQLDVTDAALTSRVLNQQEPFACISCGKPFGVRASIEKIVEKLSGKHWMFTQSDNVKLIQMCDDCRIKAQFQAQDAPMALGASRRTRTTDDYLADAKNGEDEG